MALVHRLDDRHAIGIYAMNLGEIYHLQHRHDAASTAYHEALGLLQEFHNPQIEMDILANLGALYTDLGEFDQALAHYDQALHLLEAVRNEISDTATQANFFATTIDQYYANALLCATAADDAVQAFHYSEQARARQLRDEWTEDARETSLAPRSAPVDLEAVQSALNDDEVILTYFTTGVINDPQSRFRSVPGTTRHRFPAAKTLLLALTHTTVDLLDLGLSPNKLHPHQSAGVVERFFLQPALRHLLYEKLLAPVESRWAEKRQIYLIPHGPLHQIPFQALIDSAKEPLPNQDGPIFRYAPSVTLLMSGDFNQSGMARTARPLSPPKCLALGYNGHPNDALRYAEAEAQRVAQLTNGIALTGNSPKKVHIQQAHAQYPILHISCHGHFVANMPLSSALHIGPTERLTIKEVLSYAPGDLAFDLVALSACESGLSWVRRGDELLGFARAFLHAGTKAVIATLWRVDERATYLLMERFYDEIQQGCEYGLALLRAQSYLRTLPATVCPTDPGLAMADTGKRITASYKPTMSSSDNAQQSSSHCPFADPFYWAPFILIYRTRA